MVVSPWLGLVLGGVLLYQGAEWFVAGASRIASALKVPSLLIGLTVVAYGTSAPEVIVGLKAAYAGYGDVALGNVVGSNIANCGLILGVVALMRPPRVDGSLAARELPVLLASTALVPLLVVGGLSRAEGAALVMMAMAYTAWMVLEARSFLVALHREGTANVEEVELRPVAGVPKSGALAALGLGVLLVGGHAFVEGAVELARLVGMSERVVGLTVVAIGTSLPELITSLVAARRGHAELAIGNVVGSNIFNVLLCLGSAALARPLDPALERVAPDLVSLLVITLVAALFLRTARRMSRLEGAILLIGYFIFLGRSLLS